MDVLAHDDAMRLQPPTEEPSPDERAVRPVRLQAVQKSRSAEEERKTIQRTPQAGLESGVSGQGSFNKGLCIILPPPGLGFFELSPMDCGNDVDPTSQHGLPYIGLARDGRVVGMRVVNTDHIQVLIFRGTLGRQEFLGRKGEVKPPAAFVEQNISENDDLRRDFPGRSRPQEEPAAFKRIGGFRRVH